MARVFLIVLDSLGIGAMPDAGQFGDEGTNTLRSATGGSDAHYPNLKEMGLFNIDGVDFSKGTREPSAAYARMTGEIQRKGYHDRSLGDCGNYFRKTAPGLPGWISGGDPCAI